MDREKKRTKEEEEELDRKIAQIREKNQKIVERTREVEEDRAKFAGEEPREIAKPAAESPTSNPKKGEWSREWDQGKTSADTWRENVPSIELSNRLAGRGGRGKSGGGRGNSHNNKPRNQPDLPKGSRLGGRLTLSFDGKERENAGNRNARGGGKSRPNADVREVTKKGKDLKVKVVNEKSIPGNQQQNPKQKQQQQKTSSAKKEKSGENTNNKERKSHNDDRHVIKLIIKKAIDKIEYLERCEKRRLKQEAENSFDVPETDEHLNETHPNELKSEEEISNKDIDDNHEVEENLEADEQDEIQEQLKSEEEHEEEGQKQEKVLENEEECNQDANQNVIKVVKEKVLTLEVSS